MRVLLAVLLASLLLGTAAAEMDTHAECPEASSSGDFQLRHECPEESTPGVALPALGAGLLLVALLARRR